MNIIDWIKMGWQTRSLVTADAAIIKANGGLKPGILSTEFVSKVLAVDIPCLVDLFQQNHMFDPKVAIIVLGVTNIFYAAYRTWLKGHHVGDLLNLLPQVLQSAMDMKAGNAPQPITVDTTVNAPISPAP